MQELPRDDFADFEPWREIFSRTSPVLMYHKMGRRPRGLKFKGLTIPTQLFRRQLADMKAAGVGFGSLSEPFEINKVVLTFDDGSTSIHREALPVLHEYGVRTCNYIVADRIGGYNEWDVRDHGEVRDTLMDKVQLREWLAAGQEIGSHTLSHARLPFISHEQMRNEIFDSKKKLEDIFQIPVIHFCYPYGFYDARSLELVEAAGYRTATLVGGGIATPEHNPFLIPRITARKQSLNFRNFFRALIGLPPKRKKK